MHFHACPYCPPGRKTNLIKLDEATHEEWEEEDGEKSSEEFVKDLFSYKCEKCEEHFLGTEDFLKEQKRKIKDG
jgi:hypothetical protein